MIPSLTVVNCPNARARARRGTPRSPQVGASVAVLVALALACTSATEAAPPVASIAITPSHSALAKGASRTLDVSMLDSAGAATTASITWTTSAPAVATVSEAGVVTATGYGVATIVAAVNGKQASAEVVVTGAPVTGAYSVLDLTPVPAQVGFYTYLNDKGEVLAHDAGSALASRLYRDGVGSPVPGCTAIALNNLSHLLCQVGAGANFNRYELWRDGVRTPLAASDTFTAVAFQAFALNDSDVVAAFYYQPTFRNANCAPTTTCLAVWKDGQPTFPGWSPPNYITQLNNRLELVSQFPMAFLGDPRQAVVYDVTARQQRSVRDVVKGMNDQGAVVIAVGYGGHGSPLGTAAVLSRRDTTVTFGEGEATGINNAGAVVGTLDVGPFLWTAGGVSLLTNAATDPGWTIRRALRINNRGQILAQASHVDGRAGHWVVLTPVAR
jgi:hypothetical protein